MKIMKDIHAAKDIIKTAINKTPLILAKNIKRRIGINLYFKPEVFQKTGSFKIRGILNRLHYLTKKEKRRGVITFSAGSHALSLAYATFLLRMPCAAVMPENVPSNKIGKIEKYGAKIILADKNIREKCRELQCRYQLTMIHPFDDPQIIAGHGTIGLEILDELPGVDAIFVPVGGGGLISGIAAAVKLLRPKTKIVGVEPVGAPTMFESVQKNKIVYLKRRGTIADCLATPFVGRHTLNYTKKYVDDLILVSDEEILEAMRFIWEQNGIKVEPSAAISLAPVISAKAKISRGANVVCVLSGGNIDKKQFFKLFKNKGN